MTVFELFTHIVSEYDQISLWNSEMRVFMAQDRSMEKATVTF
jgi:hypothetical protein